MCSIQTVDVSMLLVNKYNKCNSYRDIYSLQSLFLALAEVDILLECVNYVIKNCAQQIVYYPFARWRRGPSGENSSRAKLGRSNLGNSSMRGKDIDYSTVGA